MSSSMQVTGKCRKNAVKFSKRLYRPRRMLIVNSPPPGGRVDLSPSWRNLTVYIDPLFTRQDINDMLILSIIMAYTRRSIVRGIAEALAILSVAFVGSFVNTVAGPWSAILYFAVLIASALIAGYIIILSRSMTGKLRLQPPWMSVVLSDPVCRATVESVKQLLVCAINERDKDARSNESGEGKLRWPRRVVIPNHYRDIVKEYPVLTTIVGSNS